MVALADTERHVRVTVNTLENPPIVINPNFGETQLAVAFSVTKTMDPEPSTASLTISDLGRTTREQLSGVIRRTYDVSSSLAFIENTLVRGSDIFPNGLAREITFQNGDAYVTLEAGNGPGIKQVFEGSGGRIESIKGNPSWATTIQAGDGQSGDLSALSNKFFDLGTPVISVLKHLLVSWGVGFGNLSEATIQAILGDKSDFPDGFWAVGHPRELIAYIFRFVRGIPVQGQLGVNPPRWFIDDGEFYLIAPDGFLPLPPLELSIGRGLMGNPIRIESGAIEIQAFLDPEIRLARQITIAGTNFAGAYRCEAVNHSGSNRSGEFRSAATLRSVETIPGVF